MAFPAYTPKARVQKPAPHFSATAVVDGTFEELSLTAYTSTKQWLVLGFVPMAWTFVCPTEIIAFSERIADFAARNASVVFASTDSEYSLLAWTNASRRDGGLGKIAIPLLADKNHGISKDYGVLIEEEGIALRGLFLIDPNGIVRQITINDLPVGRSVDETLRLIDAFQFTDKYGEVCPANWNPGDETIKATPAGNKEYLAKLHADTNMSDVAKTNGEVYAMAMYHRTIIPANAESRYLIDFRVQVHLDTYSLPILLLSFVDKYTSTPVALPIP
ncbi:cTPxI [Pleosporales sp. CAS-2024a]